MRAAGRISGGSETVSAITNMNQLTDCKPRGGTGKMTRATSGHFSMSRG